MQSTGRRDDADERGEDDERHDARFQECEIIADVAASGRDPARRLKTDIGHD
jgi:hypothetical protein